MFFQFKWNQETIAKTLCVKRAEKVNTCNGQCHLKKQFQKAEKEENDQQRPNSQKDKVEVIYFQEIIQSILVESCTVIHPLASYFGEPSNHVHGISTEIFQPPQLLV